MPDSNPQATASTDLRPRTVLPPVERTPSIRSALPMDPVGHTLAEALSAGVKLVNLAVLAWTRLGHLPHFAANQKSAAPRSALSWSVNLHADEFSLDQAIGQLDRARALGMSFVRTDFSWCKLEPVPGSWDFSALDFFRKYLAAAKDRGLDVICILDHPPPWALSLVQSGHQDEYFARYKEYAQRVAAEYGRDLFYYQYGNETNSLVDPIAAKDDWKLFLAGDQGVRAGDLNGHEGAANFITDITTRPTWISNLRYQFSQLNAADPSHQVRMIGLDEYPGTWSPGGAYDWKALGDLLDEIDDPKSPVHGFDASMMETGFSSFKPKLPFLPRMINAILQLARLSQVLPSLGELPPNDQSLQASWYKEALPVLTAKLEAFNARHADPPFKLVNLYELVDGHLDKPYDPESNFGIYRQDMHPKPAAEIIRSFLHGIERSAKGSSRR